MKKNQPKTPADAPTRTLYARITRDEAIEFESRVNEIRPATSNAAVMGMLCVLFSERGMELFKGK